MSVLIKGMEAPHDCYECEFSYTLDGCCHCSLLHDGCVEPYMDKRAEDCPMVEIPSEHGRLIDADKIIADYVDYGIQHFYDVYDLQDILDEVPVVVPAEKGGAE